MYKIGSGKGLVIFVHFVALLRTFGIGLTKVTKGMFERDPEN